VGVFICALEHKAQKKKKKKINQCGFVGNSNIRLTRPVQQNHRVYLDNVTCATHVHLILDWCSDNELKDDTQTCSQGGGKFNTQWERSVQAETRRK